MKRHSLTIFALFALSFTAQSQAPYADILRSIEANNLTIQSAGRSVDVANAEARTGLNPADPEVEFGYLWSKPSPNGPRKDVSVTQS